MVVPLRPREAEGLVTGRLLGGGVEFGRCTVVRMKRIWY